MAATNPRHAAAQSLSVERSDSFSTTPLAPRIPALARRTRALLLDDVAASETAPLVAKLLARELRRNDAWIREQVRTFQQLARGYTFTSPESTPILAPAPSSAAA